MPKYLLVGALLLAVTGCTSFRTIALYRFENDSVQPEATNRKLAGLPVKLKVPSHLHVTIYEQQVILANSDAELTTREAEAKSAAADVIEKQTEIDSLGSDVDNARAESDIAFRELLAINQRKNALELDIASIHTRINDDATPDDQKPGLGFDKKNREAELAAVKIMVKNLNSRYAKAQQKLSDAQNKLLTKPALEAKLAELEAKAEIAAREAVRKYTLVAFDPAQFVVETQLQYTDKIFLVDFKRPAGGVLDLKEASMDDEQYFSKIQAEVQERTLADIGTALDTIKDPLASLMTRNDANIAVPTSSATPVEQSNNTVNFQSSVVATQRFDISEIGWEGRLKAFVDEHLSVHSDQVSVGHYPSLNPSIIDAPRIESLAPEVTISPIDSTDQLMIPRESL